MVTIKNIKLDGEIITGDYHSNDCGDDGKIFLNVITNTWDFDIGVHKTQYPIMFAGKAMQGLKRVYADYLKTGVLRTEEVVMWY